MTALDSDRRLLQRRLRALLLVGSLLLPAWCVFGALSFLAVGWARYVILGVWLLASIALSVVVARGLKTLVALNDERR